MRVFFVSSSRDFTTCNALEVAHLRCLTNEEIVHNVLTKQPTLLRLGCSVASAKNGSWRKLIFHLGREKYISNRGLVREKIRGLGMQCCGVVGMDHHSLTLVKNIRGLMESIF